jgi:hypothetical protein
MNKLAQLVSRADINQQRDVWLALNKRVLLNIAEELDVTATFVSQVFRGKRTSSAVSAALAKRGAPGFEEEKKSPAA